MFVDYELPAVIRVTPARGHKEKHLLCKIRGRSDIREVSVAEAPLVGVIHRADGKSKYRSIDGHLYAVVGRFTDLRKGLGSKRFLKRTRIEDRLLEIARTDLASQPRSSVNQDSILMSNAGIPQFKGHEPPDLFRPSRFENIWTRIPTIEDRRLSPDGEADVERWRHIVDTALEGVVLCEDSVWLRVPEPCIAVFPDSTRVYASHGDSAFYAEGNSQPAPHGKETLYWRDVQDVCFSVNDWEQACAFVDAHIAEMTALSPIKTHRTFDVVRIEVFDPAAFSFDFETAEFRRLADRVSHLGTTAMRVPSRPSTWKKKAPAAFIEALAQLDVARAVEDGSSSTTESALEHVLETVNRLGDPLSAAGLRCDVFARSINRGLERWADRPITLETGGPAHGTAWIGRQR